VLQNLSIIRDLRSPFEASAAADAVFRFLNGSLRDTPAPGASRRRHVLPTGERIARVYNRSR